MLYEVITNQTLVLTIDGEMNSATVEEIRPIIDVFIQKSRDVLVDINAVSFIDSSGISALVYLYKQLQMKNRRMSLICKEGQPRDLLSILHIDRSITCYSTIRDFFSDTKELPVSVSNSLQRVAI